MILYSFKPYIGGNFFNVLQLGEENVFKDAVDIFLILGLVHFVHIYFWHISGYIGEKTERTLINTLNKVRELLLQIVR